MSLSEDLKQAWHSHLIANYMAAITTSIIALLFWGFPNIFEKISDAGLRMFSSKELLTMLGLLLLLCCMLIAYIVSYRKKINELTELTPENGIYWDKKKENAYCPKEKHLMSPYNQNKKHYVCKTCNQSYAVEPEDEYENHDTDTPFGA